MFENISLKEIFLQEREYKYGDRDKVEELIERAEKYLRDAFGNNIIEIIHHESLPDNVFCVNARLKSSTDFLEATKKMDDICANDLELVASCVYPYFSFEDSNGDVMFWLLEDIKAGGFQKIIDDLSDR